MKKTYYFPNNPFITWEITSFFKGMSKWQRLKLSIKTMFANIPFDVYGDDEDEQE